MVAVLEYYEAVLSCLEIISASDSTETGSKSAGLLTSFQTFQVSFGLLLGTKVFGPAEEFSILLQKPSITCLAAQTAAKVLLGKLKHMRCDESFDTFWMKATAKALSLQIAEPTLPKIRRPPKRIDGGCAGTVF